MVRKGRVLVAGKPFQTVLIFVMNDRSLPQTFLTFPGRDKRSSLFCGARALSITTFCLTTLSIMTLSITIKNRDTQPNDTHHNGTQYCYAECLSWVSFMLNVLNKLMLHVVRLNVVMLSVVSPILPLCQ